MSELNETISQEAEVPSVEAEAQMPETSEAAPAEAEVQAEAPAEVESSESMDSFLNSLSDDLKTNKSLQNFKDVEGLAKSYLHLNSLLGKKFSDMSPEELDSYYTKLGRPEAQDGYKLPDTIEQQETSGWYKEQAFKLGLTQDQAKGLAESYHELEQDMIQKQQAQMQQAQEQWMADIKQEFGGAFEQRIETAKTAVREYGGEELKQYLNETGLGNHPAMVKAFAKIGQDMAEDSLTTTEAKASFGTTPSEAKQELALQLRDPDFMQAYKSPSHPGHKDAVAQRQRLYQIAHPENG